MWRERENKKRRTREEKVEFTANVRNMHYYKFLRSHNSLTKVVVHFFVCFFLSPHGWSLLAVAQKQQFVQKV